VLRGRRVDNKVYLKPLPGAVGAFRSPKEAEAEAGAGQGQVQGQQCSPAQAAEVQSSTNAPAKEDVLMGQALSCCCCGPCGSGGSVLLRVCSLNYGAASKAVILRMAWSCSCVLEVDAAPLAALRLCLVYCYM